MISAGKTQHYLTENLDESSTPKVKIPYLDNLWFDLDVLVVKGNKEHAIPYLPDETVTEIDLQKREMHVKWDVI